MAALRRLSILLGAIFEMKNPRAETGSQDAMDWYLGGASREPANSGSRGMEAKPAAGMPLVLQKINLVTALAALLLFFLPWIDFQCCGKSMATPTGIQTIHLELILLGIPALVLTNGLIDRLKSG
jgi:hypothetical protein